MNAFRKSLPITATSFVNKCGEIGLNLIPMLLIERQVSTVEASTVLGVIKIALPIGILCGGWLSDHFGVRLIYLLSFAFSAFGLLGIPFAKMLWLLTFLGVLAQFGKALFMSSSRMMLTQLVEPHEQKESLGWFRTGNNMGQIFSYLLGAIFSAFGTTLFFVFDGITSLLALIMGFKWIPKHVNAVKKQFDPNQTLAEVTHWTLIARMAFVIGGFNLVYELYCLSVSATCRLIYGESGLKMFSLMMVVNTVLCTMLAVPAAKFFKKPLPVLTSGLLLIGFGAALTYIDPKNLWVLFGGIFLVTFGEIIFASLSQFVLLQMTNRRKNPGTSYASVMALQSGLRAISGVMSFPLIVHGTRPSLVFMAVTGPFILMVFSLKKYLTEQK